MMENDAVEVGYLNFRPIPFSGKTKRWEITNKEKLFLGGISWFPPWRRYCFKPGFDTIFEEDCLRHIANFCEKATREHKGMVSK